MDPAGPVLAGPPPELDLAHFRDPYVWVDGSGWRMLLGGGKRSGRALALKYSSADLRTWQFDGVLAERATTESEPVWTGSVWECPQLFPLGEDWVLLVSAWDDGPCRVFAAVGDYDGKRFTARAWQPLDATGEAYATTACADAAGRRCILSWIPRGPPGEPWAGMLTVPHVLSLDRGRLVQRPHPDVDTLRTTVLVDVAGVELRDELALTGPVEPLLDLDLLAQVPVGGRLALVVSEEGAGEVLRINLDRTAQAAGVERPGIAEDRLAVPVGPDGAMGVRLLLDRGVAELSTADGAVAVLRLDRASGGPVRLQLVTEEASVRLVRIRAHGMTGWFDRG